MATNKDEWGNIELPGFGDDKLLSPNVNKILANIENSKKVQQSPALRKKQKINAQKKRKDINFVKKQLQNTRKVVSTTEWKISHSIGIEKRSSNDQWRNNVGGWNKGIPHTDEVKNKMRKPRSEEAKLNMRGPRQKKTCPYCGFVGAGGNMTRYHFDNCKLK